MDKRTKDLLDRTFYFGVGMMKFLKKLPDDSIYKVPKLQVARSAFLLERIMKKLKVLFLKEISQIR